MGRKKYKLTNETIEVNGKTLYRIKAIRSFADVDKGDLGGFVEKEDNLSHEGKCWIYDNAKVYDNACVYGNAFISDNAEISDYASVSGNACVSDNAGVYGSAYVYDHAHVRCNAHICGRADISGKSIIRDNAFINDNAKICGNAKIHGNAQVYGLTLISDSVNIYGDARIGSRDDIYYSSKSGIRDTGITFFKCNDGLVRIACDELRYTLEDFIWKLEWLCVDSDRIKECLALIDLAKLSLRYNNDNMDKKYELTDETVIVDGRRLHRIKALRDFGNVYEGDLGGFVEKEENLSHEGDCWIFDDANVYKNAYVTENAYVRDQAYVSGNARISGDARVYEFAHVHGNACVSDNAHVYGHACVFDDAKIHGKADVCCYMTVLLDANIASRDDICSISGFGTRYGDCTTFFKCSDSMIKVKCGCFEGTLNEFRNKVKKEYGDNQYATEYLAIADTVKLRLSRKKGKY